MARAGVQPGSCEPHAWLPPTVVGNKDIDKARWQDLVTHEVLRVPKKERRAHFWEIEPVQVPAFGGHPE